MIKIKLNGKKGVDYNAYVDSYFADLVPQGFPTFLPDPQKFSGKEILLLGADHGKNTKALILDGKGFLYDYNGHTLSGTLKSVTLATLGKSYKKGEYKTDKKGFITKVSDTVEISGLKISNPKDVRGDLHDTIYALMGGDVGEHGTSGLSNPAVLFSFVNGEGQKVKGTKKGDAYKGTDFADKVNLDKGDDVLNGAGGDDTLKGGKGKDTFVFDTALGPNNVDKIKDFDPKDDTIHLSASIFAGLATGKLDADAFTIGSGASDANDRIIYDKKSGVLSFDADGTGGIAPVEFARLGKNLDLHADDFLVI
jgi:Ca2+-binding RTX toxin-like protein